MPSPSKFGRMFQRTTLLGGGRVPKVDFVDLTALGLRALRVVGGQSRLMIDFAMPQPAVSKYHAIARPVIAYVARTWAPAEIRMATPDEAGSYLTDSKVRGVSLWCNLNYSGRPSTCLSQTRRLYQ